MTVRTYVYVHEFELYIIEKIEKNETIFQYEKILHNSNGTLKIQNNSFSTVTNNPFNHFAIVCDCVS